MPSGSCRSHRPEPFDIAAAQPVIADPVTRHIAELAGLAYEMVLHLLLRFFTHTDETDEQLGVLIDAGVDLMAGVLRPLAVALARMPVGEGYPGRTAGFTFEMYYLMGNLVPWREPAWALLHERMHLLVDHCSVRAPEGHESVRAARERAAAIAERLAAHVPASMRQS
jgi:hypothetical protein